MATSPLTPLGKPLSQSPVAASQTPIGQTVPAGQTQPISVFQWISLARASWTWLIRPLWYFCFVWPFKALRYMSSSDADAEQRRRRVAANVEQSRRQDDSRYFK
jgi:hypothetical protein